MEVGAKVQVTPLADYRGRTAEPFSAVVTEVPQHVSWMYVRKDADGLEYEVLTQCVTPQ